MKSKIGRVQAWDLIPRSQAELEKRQSWRFGDVDEQHLDSIRTQM